MASVEAQSQYIIKEIVTWDQYALSITNKRNESDSKWASARLSVQLQAEIGDELDLAAIRDAVGYLYGVAAATVRRRERAGEYITAEDVTANPDVMFTHWRTAVDSKRAEEIWHGDIRAAALEVVSWMYEYQKDPDRGNGRLPSVATVDGWVYGDEGKAELVWRSRSDGIVDQLGKVFHDPHTPSIFRPLVGLVRGMLRRYLDDGVNPYLDDSPITDDAMTGKTMSNEDARRQLL